MNEKDIALKNETKRYQLIIEVYKTADGIPFRDVNIKAIADSLGFSEMEFLAAHWYFDLEGFFAMNGDEIVSLSHQGIVEIEKSIKNPKQSTEHFSSTIIQNFNAPVGSVQTGNHTVANVNQTIGQNFSEILEQLANLKREFQSLPDGDREEAIEVVDALEVEVQSENPSKGKVKAFLSSVKDFALKTGTDVTSKVVVELIKSQMGL